MEWWIFWIYGWFWEWKTLWAVYIILEKLKKWEIIFSNILLDKKYLPNPDNYYFFDDMSNFYDILAFSWLFAMKVSEFSKKEVELWFLPFPRNFRPKINVFFDETWIFANAKDYKEIHKEYWADLQQYILQMRKLFVTTYLIIQRPHQLVSDLRIHISWWLKFKPLFWINFFKKYCWSYWLQELDPDTFKVICEVHYSYDENGKLYSYDIPQQKRIFWIFWKPLYYKYYNDLYLNKIFETKFRTNYLSDSWFFSNLKNWSIQNKALLHNKNIYESYFIITDNTDQSFKLPKVAFYDNPYYFIHKSIVKLSMMIKSFSFKNILTLKLK